MIKYNPYNWEIKIQMKQDDKKDKNIEDVTYKKKSAEEVQIDFLNNLWKKINSGEMRFGSMKVTDHYADVELYFRLHK